MARILQSIGLGLGIGLAGIATAFGIEKLARELIEYSVTRTFVERRNCNLELEDNGLGDHTHVVYASNVPVFLKREHFRQGNNLQPFYDVLISTNCDVPCPAPASETDGRISPSSIPLVTCSQRGNYIGRFE
ncbi:hypothetical protein J4421_01090 [Candidatus Woesearchaeota archaeon]|nr:hypothetical protein [Candidatus Woesearchaeota archaeon]